MGLQTSGDPSPPDPDTVPPFTGLGVGGGRPGVTSEDEAEDYSSVWAESLPPSSRPVSGVLRPDWDTELATSFEWASRGAGQQGGAGADRDSASGTLPKSPKPGTVTLSTPLTEYTLDMM